LWSKRILGNFFVVALNRPKRKNAGKFVQINFLKKNI